MKQQFCLIWFALNTDRSTTCFSVMCLSLVWMEWIIQKERAWSYGHVSNREHKATTTISSKQCLSYSSKLV